MAPETGAMRTPFESQTLALLWSARAQRRTSQDVHRDSTNTVKTYVRGGAQTQHRYSRETAQIQCNGCRTPPRVCAERIATHSRRYMAWPHSCSGVAEAGLHEQQRCDERVARGGRMARTRILPSSFLPHALCVNLNTVGTAQKK